MKRLILIAALAFVLVHPTFALAYQLQVATSSINTISNPTVSTGYFGKLVGDPHVYFIKADEPFSLYVSVLMPDTEASKLDVSAAIIQDGRTAQPLTVFDQNTARWELYYDESTRTFFRQHSEFRSVVPAGEYEIRVWGSNNDSPYMLLVGEKEETTPGSLLRNYQLLPEIKENFFGESRYTAYFSPALLVPMSVLVAGIVVVLLAIHLLRRQWKGILNG